MSGDRARYRWLYDKIHCHYYDLLMKWCFLPLGGERSVRRVLVDAIDLQAEDHILDMCCGTGGATFEIASRLDRRSPILGIDLSAGQIHIARRKNRLPNVAFAVMDAARTALPDGAFDRVVIPHALHEMPRRTREAVLKEAARLLKKDRTVAILEMDTPPGRFRRLYLAFFWFYWLPFNPETPTRRDMLEHSLLREVWQAGFKDVRKVSLCRGALQVVTGSK